LARGHRAEAGALVATGPLPDWHDVTGGAGLACGTLAALGAWGNLLLRDRALLGRLAQPVLLADGSTSTYGYGVIDDDATGTRRVAHSGGMLGHSARIAVLPDLDATVVVLATTPSEAVVRSIETRLTRELQAGAAAAGDHPDQSSVIAS
jgi:CubicO group peptidase (beta-lactamase class C family)